MRFVTNSALSLALVSSLAFCSNTFAQTAVSAAGLPTMLAAETSSTATPLTSSTHLSEVAATSSSSDAALPDSPSFLLEGEGARDAEPALYQSGKGGVATSGSPIAPKYATTILPGQSSQPLSGGDKVTFAFRNVVSPFNFLSILISATYSQGVDSAPHYGQGWGPYGQRIGAAAARNSIQNLAGQALFAPMFHDDPRYYVLGRQHKFFNRVVYAATRVVVTRSDSGSNRVNAPLLLGYAVAAGANNAYYPQRDRGGKETAISYGSSLGGAVLGMEVSEFLNDALGIVHLRHTN